MLHVLRTRIHTLEQRIDVLLNTARICLCRCHYIMYVSLSCLKKHAMPGQKMFLQPHIKTKEIIFTHSVS